MHTDTYRKYAALQRVFGAGNETKRRRFFVPCKILIKQGGKKVRKTKKFLAVILAASMAIGLCQTDASAAKAPKAAKKITVTVGSSRKLKVTGSFIKSKKFKSSDTKIASVSKKGLVKAKKAGKCKITVTVKYRKSRKSKKVYKKVLKTAVTVKKAKPKPTVTPSAVPTAEPTATPEVTPTAKPMDTPAPSTDPSVLTAATQESLEAALKEPGLRSLTLQTDAAEKFTIPAGQYKDIDLTVIAPNADIENLRCK